MRVWQVYAIDAWAGQCGECVGCMSEDETVEGERCWQYNNVSHCGSVHLPEDADPAAIFSPYGYINFHELRYDDSRGDGTYIELQWAKDGEPLMYAEIGEVEK